MFNIHIARDDNDQTLQINEDLLQDFNSQINTFLF